MSPHLHGRLKTLDAIASKWPASETFGRQRWQQHQVQLKILQELDWREDMYQLGYWLAKIRDGDEDGSWGDVRYVGDVINIREVNAFISNFPEELMKWGQESDLPGEMPHIGYIKRINDLVSALPAVPDTFTLHRRDYDTAYKTYIEVIPNRENTSLDDASWKQACSIDSAESYAHYLAEWPYGFSAHEAQSRMSKRQTNHVQQIHSQRLPLWTALNRSANETCTGGPCSVSFGWVELGFSKSPSTSNNSDSSACCSGGFTFSRDGCLFSPNRCHREK
jgi:hypothetical protein